MGPLMLTDMKKTATNPPAGRAWITGSPAERLAAVRQLCRQAVTELRTYRDRRQRLIDACDGPPVAWAVPAAAAKPRPTAVPMDQVFGSPPMVQVIAGTAEAATDSFCEWRRLAREKGPREAANYYERECFPNPPLAQAWWPPLLRAAFQRLRHQLRVSMSDD